MEVGVLEMFIYTNVEKNINSVKIINEKMPTLWELAGEDCLFFTVWTRAHKK